MFSDNTKFCLFNKLKWKLNRGKKDMEAFERNCPLGGLLCHPGWEEMRQAERSLSALLFVFPFPPASLLHVYTLSVQVKVLMNAGSHARWHTQCSLSSRASDRSRPVEVWLQDSKGDSLLVSLIWGDSKQPKWIPQLVVPLLLLPPPFWLAAHTRVATIYTMEGLWSSWPVALRWNASPGIWACGFGWIFGC